MCSLDSRTRLVKRSEKSHEKGQKLESNRPSPFLGHSECGCASLESQAYIETRKLEADVRIMRAMVQGRICYGEGQQALNAIERARCCTLHLSRAIEAAEQMEKNQ